MASSTLCGRAQSALEASDGKAKELSGAQGQASEETASQIKDFKHRCLK